MPGLATGAASPLRHDAPTNATSAPLVGHAEVNGICLPYVEQGSGQPVVFVHGALSDLRGWEPVRQEMAKRGESATKYRFIAYSQRYFGTHRWTDSGKRFSAATHADDLVKFIAALDTGPVHLVGTSYGGLVVTTAAITTPTLVRSLVLYEPALACVFPNDSEDGKAARENRAEFIGPVISAIRAGDTIRAARLMHEAVNQLPSGGFEREPLAVQTRVLDNARTLPSLFAALSSSDITCNMLRNFAHPTLVMRGEKTQAYYTLINERLSRCISRVCQVVLNNANHGAPHRDPVAFTAAVFEFLSKH